MSIIKNNDNISVQFKDAGGNTIQNFNGRKTYKEQRDEDGGTYYVAAETSPNVQKNVLHKFSSFNTIFTLSCLTVDEINNPYSLRIKTPEKVILRNGGSSASKFPTQYDKPLDGSNSGTAAREFFITDVDINTVISPNPKTKHTNAYKINFTVIEPYSLGTFIETLRTVAASCGHKNHTAAPYCLMMEFKGYDETGKIYNVEGSKRIMPIKIIQIDFDANQAGSTYACQATAWNEFALDGVIQSINTDITLKGSTVQEMLQVSLQDQLNQIKDKSNQDKDQRKHKIDDYIINFPTPEALQNRQNTITPSSDAATAGKITPNEQRKVLVGTNTDVNSTPKGLSYKQNKDSLNAIGGVKLLVSSSQVENVAQNLGYDKNSKVIDTAQIGKDLNRRKLSFKQGSNIENIITTVITFSEYAAKSLNDNSGTFKKWFRISTRTFIIKDDDIMQKYGRNPYLFVYDVIPYDVHESSFAKPNVKTETKDIESQIVKEYDYLYTGKNLDVLDFQLKYNFAFLAILPSDQAKSKSRPDDKDKDSKDGNNSSDSTPGDTADSNTGSGTSTMGVVRRQFNLYEAISGLSDEQRLALEFNEAIIHSNADLITVNLTILGDPYYIADSGMGNYYASIKPDANGKPSKFINKDGAMEGTYSGVYIAINFRTPIDYGSNGETMFRDTAQQAERFIPVPAFSGIYKVNMVNNIFQGAVFKQELQCIRLQNQEIKKAPEKDNKALGGSNALNAVGTTFVGDGSA